MSWLVKRLSILTVGAVLLQGTAVTEESMPTGRGVYSQKLVLEDGTPLRYALSVPGDYSSLKPVPLIVALHYGGRGRSLWYGKGFLLTLVLPALRELKAIIIAPDCPTTSWEEEAADRAVLALMAHIQGHYDIDTEKILVTGFSLGGIGTWAMAARHPDIFSAAIPVSALPNPFFLERLGPIPIHIIHSTGDELFPIREVETIARDLSDRGFPVELAVIEGVSHYRTAEFVEALRETIPWINEVWAGGGPEKETVQPGRRHTDR